MSSADNMCNQCGPISELTAPGSKPFDTLKVFLIDVLKKKSAESRRFQRHEKLPSMPIVNCKKIDNMNVSFLTK